jgi:predicted dehydrogenase
MLLITDLIVVIFRRLMPPYPKIVMLVGAGQLGSRHLQGLVKCNYMLSIYVVDPSLDALAVASQRWNDAGGEGSFHKVRFCQDLDDCPIDIDLAIVATTASHRAHVVSSLAERGRISYWILEKVLAQNIGQLAELIASVGAQSQAWVNTPRRTISWHRELKNQLNTSACVSLQVEGGPWGMACNAIHFFDLMAWWTGEKLISINTDSIESLWIKAKRANNWEIAGSLKGIFSDGSTVVMTSRPTGNPTYTMDVSNSLENWHIDETQGFVRKSSGKGLSIRLPLQSEMTASLVEDILSTGTCQLPDLISSVAIHSVLLDALLNHWRCHNDASANCVPIT